MATKTQLSLEDMQKLVAWLDGKWPGYKCDVCGTNAWTAGEHLVAPPVQALSGGGMGIIYLT